MVEQIGLVLVLQIVIALFYLKFGFKVASIIGRRVCPICFAVGSTWLTLLVARYFGLILVNKFLIAILLAESVVGIANLVEEFSFVRQVKVSEPLVKFGIVCYGTLAVSSFALINEVTGLILYLPIVVFGFLALTPIRRIQETKTQKSTKLESKLKNCC